MQPLLVNASEASEPLAQNCRQLLSNWPSLAGPVLVFYDYILMLPTKMHLIWRHPKPWFLLIRYLALATNIIVVVSTFGNFGPEGLTSAPEPHEYLIVWISCKWLPMIKKSFLTVQEIIIYAILTLRVYALFNCHQVILVLLSVVVLGSLAIGVWLGTTTDATAPPPGSHMEWHFPSPKSASPAKMRGHMEYHAIWNKVLASPDRIPYEQLNCTHDVGVSGLPFGSRKTRERQRNWTVGKLATAILMGL
ncbi:hypothetical protein B0H14DRAFT_3153976 [Mycena olivaceomarginata]|nr:hypothetical protein B0H14DRAFT_3153976 [Mycena olivaceomarginata]